MADISFEVEANKVHISSEEKLGIYFCHSNLIISVMPEGEKHWGGGPVVIGGDNLPSPVRIGLTVLQNIGDWPP